MSDETLLTLRQLSEELRLPESTVRYYRDAFLDHIPSVGTGRRRRYPSQAVAVLRSIARSYAAGRSRSEIIAGIHNHGGTAAQAIPVTAEKQARTVPMEEVSNLDLLAAILDGEREQRDALWQMAKEIVRLTEVLEGQDKVLTEIADRAGVLVELPARTSRGSLAAAPATESAPVAPAVAAPQPGATREPSIASAYFSSPSSDAPPPFPVAEAPVSEPPPVAPAVTAPAPEPLRFGEGGGDIDRLRAELESERALVERLRESKLQLEHRTADAEAELADRRKGRPSVIRRLLGSEPSS